jgi:hypothetical protein
MYFYKGEYGIILRILTATAYNNPKKAYTPMAHEVYKVDRFRLKASIRL